MGANIQRGEVSIKGPGGENFNLCLTLGAIAQIEEQIEGLDSLSEIDKVMSKGRMKDLLVIFIALLNGGGHPVTQKDLMEWDIKLSLLMGKIGEAFKAAGFGEEDEAEGSSGN